jgi:hypothetical protein
MMLTATTETAKAYLPLLTNKQGNLRATKPNDGNAAYVWRMVAFSLSTNPRHHCMPMTADFGVSVPDDYLPEAPPEWLDEEISRTMLNPNDVSFCVREAGSVSAYHVARWRRTARSFY